MQPTTAVKTIESATLLNTFEKTIKPSLSFISMKTLSYTISKATHPKCPFLKERSGLSRKALRTRIRKKYKLRK
jgi:hypothetical protein